MSDLLGHFVMLQVTLGYALIIAGAVKAAYWPEKTTDLRHAVQCVATLAVGATNVIFAGLMLVARA